MQLLKGNLYSPQPKPENKRICVTWAEAHYSNKDLILFMLLVVVVAVMAVLKGWCRQ